jgi:REP element-mobilizing transposase RayT
MDIYRRKLPHMSHTGRPVFVTWSLNDSLPPNRDFPRRKESSGNEFAAMDRLLDSARTGARYMAQPAIADMIVEVLRYAADVLKYYQLHAFVVMPNHVHILITPAVVLRKITQSVKGFSARRANEVLHLTGTFWRYESYDHLVRNREEFARIQRYIEHNPVRAGLVQKEGEYRWSSAALGATWRSPADQEVRRTT